MTETLNPESHTEFAKELGLKEAVSIAVGAMIGGGIFSVLGRLARMAGPSAVISFFLGGIIALLTATSYYKIVAKYPSAGGEFVILRKGFKDKPFFGNMVGMMLWLGYSVTIALYAFTFGLYMSSFIFRFTGIEFFNIEYEGMIINGFNTHLTGRRVLAFFSILLFMIINLRGVKETGTIQNLIVLFKVSVLMFIAVVGFALFKPENYQPFFIDTNPLNPESGTVGMFGGFSGMIIGSAVIFVSYEGFQVIANTVEELKNPARDVKIGMIISIVVVTFTYCAVTIATFSLVENPHHITEDALIEAVKFMGDWAVALVAFGAAASTTSAINATLLGSSRLAYVMADYGAFPKNIAKISKKSKVPYMAIIITSSVSWFFTFFGNAEEIAEVGSIIFLGIFLSINIAVIQVFKKERPIIPYIASFLIAFYLILVFIFIRANLEQSKLTLSVLFVFLAISLVTHLYYSKKGGIKGDELKKYDLEPLGKELIQEFKPMQRRSDEFFVDLERMLVPISGELFESKAWQIAATIARKYNVEVDVLHIGDTTDDLTRPLEIFNAFRIKYRVIVKKGKNIAKTIIDSYNEGNYQLVLLSSKRRKGLFDRLITESVSKTVVDEIGATVLQVHPPSYGTRNTEIGDLFILMDGSERDAYLARWASIISSTGPKSHVYAYHIIQIPQTISLEDAADFPEVKRSSNEFEKYAKELCEQVGLDVTPILLYGHNFVKALVQATEKREPDAVLIGHTKDEGLLKRFKKRLAYRIMEKVNSAVIVHHTPEENRN
ncbi:MAG: amino acid transporter [Methanobacteriota archaeon]|nr:MAG: amino acid transporter [Euryarchaeota archaeon]